jgi:hypothetical protein
MQFIDVFVVFILLVTVLTIIQSHFAEVEPVKAKLDNRVYIVRKLPNKQDAAEYLAELNSHMQKLVKHMMAKYPNNDEVKQLFNNYNPDAMSEGSPDTGYTSYSINKGEKIILCIRQPDGRFVDQNTVLYVAIHELGHVMTKDIGHTERFWENFKFLLEEAIGINIYKKVDYASSPHEYCGIKITSSVV